MTGIYSLHYLDNPREEQHYHTDFELLYVLRGTVTGRTTLGDFSLQSGDVWVVNPGLSHCLCDARRCTVASLTLHYHQLAELLDTRDFVFLCNTSQDRSQNHRELTEGLGRFLLSCQRGDSTLKTYSALLQVLDCLVSRYLQTISTGKAQQRTTNMELVLAYIAQHYREKLSLNQICDQFYFTTSTFSRLFRKYTGTTFVQYLNQVRLNRALQSLLQSDAPISTIAVEHGFSSTVVFDKAFRERYGCSPRQYRNEFASAQSEPVSETEDAQILEYIEELNLYQGLKDGLVSQTADIDVRQSAPCPQVWNTAANAGAAIQLLAYEKQNLLEQYVNSMGCSQIRLTDVQTLFYPTRNTRAPYRAVERILSFLTMKLQATPILVFRIPSEAERSAYLSAFSDFLQYIMRRFPTEQAKRWGFEILCSIDREADLQFYSELSSLIHLFIPNALVGGFGIRAGSPIPQTFRQWLRQVTPPHFISVHVYPPEIHQNIDGQNRSRGSMNIDACIQSVRALREELQQAAPQVPFWVTEWNTTTSQHSILNDTVAKAAYVTHFISELLNEVDLAIYSAFCDPLTDGAERPPLTGGNGLLTQHGLYKPAYFPLFYLRSARERLLQKGEHYFLTTDRENHYWGLCYNDCPPNYTYFLKPEEEIGYHDLESIYETKSVIELQFALNHVRNGEYCVKVGSLNKNSSILEVLQVSDPELIAIDDYNYFIKTLQPLAKELRFAKVLVNDGVLRYKTLIHDSEVLLLHIYPLKLSV